MKSTIDELQDVENRIKSEKSHRMYERCQAIRLHLMGNTPHQIATILKRTHKTISTYIRPIKKTVTGPKRIVQAEEIMSGEDFSV
ncbi:hypothetical protein CU633_04320 [Bacillus sp. V3-13]|uniref:terminase gpP N-terminus-related DNA-binding protein n=1 Tax=Bacillus sp. V3-13 TaxID=2053728 RepID=UPI000C7760B5|nr:helix-turn-helix domain-containing protein [Bacillus sp. V3-13]PLR78634.1 hypothetical protein CU633_04320 [Bacillus sp. V3-13]